MQQEVSPNPYTIAPHPHALIHPVVYANYKSAIDVYEGGRSHRTVPGQSNTPTAGIFATYPQPFLSRTGAFFDEFIASTLLMFFLYAFKDSGNPGDGNIVAGGLFCKRPSLVFSKYLSSADDCSCYVWYYCSFWVGDRLCYESCKRLWAEIDDLFLGVWTRGVDGGKSLFLGNYSTFLFPRPPFEAAADSSRSQSSPQSSAVSSVAGSMTSFYSRVKHLLTPPGWVFNASHGPGEVVGNRIRGCSFIMQVPVYDGAWEYLGGHATRFDDFGCGDMYRYTRAFGVHQAQQVFKMSVSGFESYFPIVSFLESSLTGFPKFECLAEQDSLQNQLYSVIYRRDAR